MNSLLGSLAVAVGFAAAVTGAILCGFAAHRHDARLMRLGRRFVWVVLASSVAAVAAMERALLTHDFSLQYVARQRLARATPLFFTIPSLWGALEGSILLWALILAGYIAAVASVPEARPTDPLVAWATLVMFVVVGLLLRPDARPGQPVPARALADPAPTGSGPNPLLQNHPLMAIHPPFLYLGYVGFTVPFAFAIAALVTGRVGEGWLVETRRWTLVAWGFLTVGIVLGAWWSYEVLGWGGFWAWDPVENASFLPWLTGTAFLHSVMVQERRGHAPGLEPLPGARHVLPHDPRHVPHPLGRARLGPRLHAVRHRPRLLAFFAVVVVVSASA